MRFLAYICIVLVILANQSPIAEGQSNAPFIYYYSANQKAFVIERADGSESRVLTSYAFPEDTQGDAWVTGPGWSSSGQWFAWTATTTMGGTPAGRPQEAGAFLINARGGTPISLLQNEDETQIRDVLMLWSPVSDLLLVEIFYSGNSPNTRYFLFNPETQEKTEVLSNDVLLWSPDGQYLVSYGVDTINFITVGGSNISKDKYRKDYCDLPHLEWSKNHDFVYRKDAENLAIENLQTQEFSLIKAPDGFVLDIEWSPNSQYLLAFTSTSCTNSSPIQLWLISLDSQKSTLINQDVHLVNSQPTTNGIRSPSVWSEDGSYAFGVSSQNTIILVETLPFQVHEMPFDRFDSIPFIVWTAQNVVSFFGLVESESKISSYSLETNVLSELFNTGYAHPYYFSFSPNQQLLAFTSYDADYNYAIAIVDLSSSETPFTFPTPNEVYELRWHPEGNWLLAIGGFPYIKSITVASAYDGFARDIGNCINSPSCFGWLP
ncbi:MAG: hypothetical protein K8L91_25260 [Anaerolineae bacterium]|nr:hypothetical protein [Anaerolineae bacterium]